MLPTAMLQSASLMTWFMTRSSRSEGLPDRSQLEVLAGWRKPYLIDCNSLASEGLSNGLRSVWYGWNRAMPPAVGGQGTIAN
jgi:hypothetical protein